MKANSAENESDEMKAKLKRVVGKNEIKCTHTHAFVETNIFLNFLFCCVKVVYASENK